MRFLIPEKGVSALDAEGGPFSTQRPAMQPCRRFGKNFGNRSPATRCACRFISMTSHSRPPWQITSSQSPSNALMSANREEIVERLATLAREKIPIIGAGAGTGLSAKCEEAGGVDLILSTIRAAIAWRGAGPRPALAFGNANERQEMAREVLPVVRRTPVLAGVNGTDPLS